ncbi:MAG: glycosyltransferase [Chitinophagaceae bacterium]|jgi:polyisoprenyl-phosphate glycosyltransferase|nr:glycosyltransferase [Chitinophagaceae bacterium]
MNETRLQILLPAHNESGNIIPIYQEINDALLQTNYNFSILFVDDGSTDNTLEIIKDIASKDARVKFIELSKNFGHQNALKAGIDHCESEILIMMDCDLQHPPSLIREMLSLYEKGYEIVRTKRMIYAKEGYLKSKTSELFYRILNKFSDVKLEEGSADFRLISGAAILHLKSFGEYDLFYRGLIKWMGFKQASLVYNPDVRRFGETKYSYKKMVSFGLSGFTSFSVKPLYFAAYIGIVFAILSFLYIPYILYTIYMHQHVSGWTSIIASIAFFGSLNLIVLGIIGIYISKIFLQVKNRPHYIISETNL